EYGGLMSLRPRKRAENRAKRLAVCVGNNVRTHRERRGMSQTGFARKASIERTVLNKIESGTRAVTLVTLARLAIALGTEAWELLRPEKRRAQPSRSKIRRRSH